jgi:hypothetical protein
LGLINLVFCLLLQDGFTVEVSPELFRVEVVKSPEQPVKKQEQPAKTRQQKPYYIVMFTASWCAPCQGWKKTGPAELRAAGYQLTIVDIDVETKWRKEAPTVPRFWLVNRSTQKPVYKWIGSTPVTAMVLKAEQQNLPQRSLFGFTGTSHESRETLIKHLSEDGIHKGRHSLSQLQSMTDEQLDSLHNSDHGGKR